MYKFTNGIVVFDEKMRDRYLEVGYKLVATGEIVDNKKISDEKDEICVVTNEVIDENRPDDGTVEEKPRRSKKISK